MKILRWICIVTAVMILQGCSSRAWYDGFQMVREKECYDLQSNQRQECLDNAYTGYSQYKKDKEDAAKKDSK